MIIALNGYAKAGKDTVGKLLVDKYGYTRMAFADPMKEMLVELNPLVGGAGQRVADVVGHHGWHNAKTIYPEIRQLLQRLGTEAGRGVLGENIWVDTLFHQAIERGVRDLVVTDCRFRNEAAMTKSLGGMVWRINRPGVGPANGHASETELDDWAFDEVIENDGTFTDLFAMVDAVMRSMEWVS